MPHTKRTMRTPVSRRHIALCGVLLLVAACAANSTDYIVYFLNQGYKGHPVNEFFYHFGYPVAEFDRAGGNKVYEWSSVAVVAKPTAEISDMHHYADGSYYHMTDNYQGGGTQREYCELRIYADKDDNIQNFSIAVDSIGKWSVSRCSEIFDKTD